MSELLDRLRAVLEFGRASEFDKTALEAFKRHEFAFVRGGRAGSGGAGADDLQSAPEKKFSANGDHITVSYVGGGIPVYIRPGPDENPFVRMREGLVIERVFRQITVRIGNPRLNLTGGVGYGEVEFFTSYGPLLQLPPLEDGITRNFFADEFTVAGAATIRSLVQQVLPIDQYIATAGKHGGLLMIKNTDAGGNTVYLHNGMAFTPAGTPFGADLGYPLRPGEEIKLRLRDVFLGGNVALGYDDPQLRLAGGVGTCKVAILLSSVEADAGAIEQDVFPDAVLR